MEKGAILATYSCAGQVKRNLKEAGFEIKDGPVVGRRAPGTIAVNI
jgi:tRNA U34 5-methylaminomethyl-2-thiouridine-forming methyltransferase MnmC